MLVGLDVCCSVGLEPGAAILTLTGINLLFHPPPTPGYILCCGCCCCCWWCRCCALLSSPLMQNYPIRFLVVHRPPALTGIQFQTYYYLLLSICTPIITTTIITTTTRHSAYEMFQRCHTIKRVSHHCIPMWSHDVFRRCGEDVRAGACSVFNQTLLMTRWPKSPLQSIYIYVYWRK